MYLINSEFRGYGRSALLFFELDAISNDIDVRQVHRAQRFLTNQYEGQYNAGKEAE